MSRAEVTTSINRPAAVVFEFLASPENHPRFVPGMVELHQTSPGAFGSVGATLRGMRRDFFVQTPLSYEVTEYQPGSKLSLRGAMGAIGFEDGYIVEPDGGRTRVTFWLKLKPKGLMWLATPVLALLGRQHAAETIANLRRAVETNR